MKIESIKFENIVFAHEDQKPILQHVSFDFPCSQMVRVKSGEGAGKSTLLQILAGLQIPQEGQYLINGQNVFDMSFEEFLPYRQQIGYTFDYGGLLSNRTLFDNLMLPLLYHKIVSLDEAKERVQNIFSMFGVLDKAHERPAHVPGRIRKLTTLMRTLVLKPDLLILDDPSVGLGQDSIQIFVGHIQQLRRDGFLRHVFFSSYDEKFMGLFEFHTVCFEDGQLYLQAPEQQKRVAYL